MFLSSLGVAKTKCYHGIIKRKRPLNTPFCCQTEEALNVLLGPDLLGRGDELLDDVGIAKGRDVTHLLEILLASSHLPEDTAHDLAGSSLGEIGGRVERIRLGDGTNLLPHGSDELLLEVLGPRLAVLEDDVGIQSLTLDGVGDTNNSCLRHVVVEGNGRLDLRCAETVARDCEETEGKERRMNNMAAT
jgi:hypothetical protein